MTENLETLLDKLVCSFSRKKYRFVNKSRLTLALWNLNLLLCIYHMTPIAYAIMFTLTIDVSPCSKFSCSFLTIKSLILQATDSQLGRMLPSGTLSLLIQPMLNISVRTNNVPKNFKVSIHLEISETLECQNFLVKIGLRTQDWCTYLIHLASRFQALCSGHISEAYKDQQTKQQARHNFLLVVLLNQQVKYYSLILHKLQSSSWQIPIEPLKIYQITIQKIHIS